MIALAVLKFLRFCITQRSKINFLTCCVACAVIAISTWVFHNDYWKTKWHWIVSVIGCGIMWFVTYCIKDENVLEEYEKLKSK